MEKKPFLTKGRKKQLAVAIGFCGLMLVLVAIAARYTESAKQDRIKAQSEKQPKVQATDFSRPEQFVDDSGLWRTEEGAKITELERKQKEMEEKLKRGTSGKDQASNLSSDPFASAPPLPPAPPANGAIPSPAGTNAATEKPQSMIASVDLRRTADEPAPATDSTRGRSSRSGTSSGRVQRSANVRKNDKVVELKGIRPNFEISQENGNLIRSPVSVTSFRALDAYIPSGTFLRAELLGGVDAPTGGDAQNANPHPVLMRVSNMAQLPNRFKYNFRECMVIGSAYGDISAERAYVRTERMSCVGSDGRAIDIPIKGYVAGEDGKTGIRGPVVTKQGQVLANALLAGILSGLGQGVANSYEVTSTSAFGTTSSVKAGDEYRAGVASGFGSAMDRMAQYYIKLADKVFPVVEINAGRKVDIVLLEGFRIDTGAGEQR